jgi:hypothetical protein
MEMHENRRPFEAGGDLPVYFSSPFITNQSM